jgi:methyl-accepting chemotaxis protein
MSTVFFLVLFFLFLLRFLLRFSKAQLSIVERIISCCVLIYTVLVASVIFLAHLHAAEHEVHDSLNTALRAMPDDANKVFSYTRAADKLARSHPQQSLEYASLAEQLSERLFGQSTSERNALRAKAAIAYSFANAHYRLGNAVPALEYGFKAEQAFAELNDQSNVAKCLNRIGTIYKYQQQYTQALKSFAASLERYGGLRDSAGMSAPLNNMGETYRLMGNHPKALEYFMQTLVIDSALNDKPAMAQDLGNIGETYRLMQRYNEAQQAFEQARRLGGDMLTRSEVLSGMARLALDRQAFDQAINYAVQALAIDTAAGFKARMKEEYAVLAEAFAAKQDFPEAFQYQKRLTALNDLLFNEETSRTISAMQRSAELKQQQSEIALLKQKQERQELLQTSLLVGGGGVVLLSAFIARARRARRRARRHAEQLEHEKMLVEEKVREAVAAVERFQSEAQAQEAARLAESEHQREYLERSTREILEAMQRFAFGDLTVQVQHNGKEDDISKIFTGFNRSVAVVRTLVEQVIHNVEQTKTIAAHISSASGQMAATSEEQSAQVMQIASAVEQMARSVNETAQYMSHVSAITRQNGQSATDGAAVVGTAARKIDDIAGVVSTAASTVEKLGNSSTEIGDIVEVIEEIADQTNLLALNAAIEAARAGEQGRGFAVVADEVRKLAERTAAATKQISHTIKTIQHDTHDAVQSIRRGNAELKQGLALAHQAGSALENIVAGSHEVEGMVKSSSNAMMQQSSSAEEIAKSVEQVSASVNQTTVSLSEIATATESLRNLTEVLHKLVGRFDVGREQQQLLPTTNARHAMFTIADSTHQRDLLPSR